jgi:segregation and condensation protein B
MPTSGDTPEWVKGDLPPALQARPGEATPQAPPAPAVVPATNGGEPMPADAPFDARPEQSAPTGGSENAAPPEATAATATARDVAAGEQPRTEDQLLAEPAAPTPAASPADDDSAEPRPSDADQKPQPSAEPALDGQTDPRPQATAEPAVDGLTEAPVHAGLITEYATRNTSPATPDPRESIEALLATPLSLEALVESLLFVADGAVPVGRLAEALEVSNREVEAALASLSEVYRQRGLSLQRFRDKVQLTTSPAAASRVERFLGLAAATPLSRAALETLAIVAYQQPVTRPQIEAVRGVNSDSVIKNLLGKGLIEELGRAEGPGRPVLYSTTPEFMQHFGLASLSDLPPLSQPGPEGVLHPGQILKG